MWSIQCSYTANVYHLCERFYEHDSLDVFSSSAAALRCVERLPARAEIFAVIFFPFAAANVQRDEKISTENRSLDEMFMNLCCAIKVLLWVLRNENQKAIKIEKSIYKTGCTKVDIK